LETLFLLSGSPANGHTLQDVRKALLEQIKDLQDKPVGSDELARIKAQMRADKVYEQDSMFYQAMQIGMLETVGLSWKDGEAYLSRIEAVTPEQIQAVAKKYLVDDHLTVAELVPQPIDPKHPPRSGGGGNHVR